MNQVRARRQFSPSSTKEMVTWSFHVCTKFEECLYYCHFDKCLMKPGLFPKLVLKENKSSTSVFGNLKGLLAFGISGSVESMLRFSARDDIEVSITIKVEEETNSGILRINYEREAEAG